MPLSLFDPRVFDTRKRPPTDARLFDSRIGPTTVVIIINGVRRTARRGSLQITDELNETPNRCDFIVDSDPPPIGADVQIGLEGVAVDQLLFAGTVQKVNQRYELKKDHPSWAVACLDYTALLNRRKVFGTFENQSASAIATSIVTTNTSGFSTAGIVAGLPAITVAFDGDDVMTALKTVATQVGGYTKVDYGKVVQLFTVSPVAPPHPIDGTDPRQLNAPPIIKATDIQQLRTRVYVEGAQAAILGPPGTTIPSTETVIPIDNAALFASGKVKTDDAQILTYGSVDAGGATAVVVGNIGGPGGAPSAVIASGVAGQLQGTYLYAVAFANPQGETTAGPTTSIFAPAINTPTASLLTNVTGAPGPLIGAYSWRISFQTTLGETLPGPTTARTCVALQASTPSVNTFAAGISRLSPGSYQWRVTYVNAVGETLASAATFWTTSVVDPPSAPSVASASLIGPLMPGLAYTYRCTFVTQDGETTGGSTSTYIPAALSAPGWNTLLSFWFGGLFGGPYRYGFTIVTAQGESDLLLTLDAGSGFATPTPGGSVSWSGSQDTAGRIQQGLTYFWAFSYYSDTFGEGPLGGGTSVAVGGSVPIRMLMNVPGGFPAEADGIRIYRAITGGPYGLNAEFRRGSVPSQYWDILSQGECGALYPVQTMRAGMGATLNVTPSAEPGVTARRIYRTKSGGSEYFLVAEIQHNAFTVNIRDAFFDNQLAVRNPSANAIGRQCSLASIATGPVNTTGRRIYRSKAGGSAYFLVGEIKDNATTTWIDSLPDSALNAPIPGANTAGSMPWQIGVNIPTGPTGTVARRVYRTKVGGTIGYRLIEVPDNTTTFVADNVPDAQLNTAITTPAGAVVGEEVQVFAIEAGPAGTLARNVYRTKAGGSEYFFAGRISDNTTTTFIDRTPDTALGKGVQLTSTAGASAVQLSSIPLGPAGITQRILYRTVGNGTELRFLATLNDNTTTTYLDTRSDDGLGRGPQAVSTIGALPGDTTLRLDTVKGFPTTTPGWIRAESQYIEFTGLAGTTLTGIPPLVVVSSITRAGQVATMTTATAHGFATGEVITILGADQREYVGAHEVTVTGPTTVTYLVTGAPATPATGTLRAGRAGAITAPIKGGTPVETTALVTNVAGMTRALLVGGKLALWVQVDDVAAQAIIAAAEGGDGIHEHVIVDHALDTIAACTKRGQADLALYARAQATVTYETHDKTFSGATVHVDLPAPQSFAGDFMIQRVVISEIDMWKNTPPRFAVTASTTRYTLEDLLRHVLLDR